MRDKAPVLPHPQVMRSVSLRCPRTNDQGFGFEQEGTRWAGQEGTSRLGLQKAVHHMAHAHLGWSPFPMVEETSPNPESRSIILFGKYGMGVFPWKAPVNSKPNWHRTRHFFLFLAMHHAGSYFPKQGSNLPSALEAQSLNHWTTRVVPTFHLSSP